MVNFNKNKLTPLPNKPDKKDYLSANGVGIRTRQENSSRQRRVKITLAELSLPNIEFGEDAGEGEI